MTDREPRGDIGISEFNLRLRQVFQRVANYLRLAAEAEAEAGGGYLQRFDTIAERIMPNIAFRLIEKVPKLVDGRPAPQQMLVHIPEDEAYSTMPKRFWISHISRHGQFTVSELSLSDGIELIFNSELSEITKEELMPDATQVSAQDSFRVSEFDEFVEVDVMEQLEEMGRSSETALKELADALSDKFELTTFR